MRHVAHALTAPFQHFELGPLGVMIRSHPADREPSQLTFRLDAEPASIWVTTVAARDGLAVTLTLYGSRHELLPRTRVQIRQEGLAVF